MSHLNRPFRYAAGLPYSDEVFKLPKLVDSPAPTGTSCAASAHHIAALHGSSNNELAILPTKYSTYTKKQTPCVVAAHADGIADWVFAPHNDALLATCGQRDATVKIWNLGGTDPLSTSISSPQAEIDCSLGQKLQRIRWHPSAEGVLACSGKQGVTVFDVAARQAKLSCPLSGHGKDICSVAWSHDGSTIAAVGINRTLYLVDPRKDNGNELAAGTETAMSKPHHALWVGKTRNTLLLVGLDKYHTPMVEFHDPRNIKKPILKRKLEFSTGYTLPMYEPDSDLLFITMRGSTSLVSFDLHTKDDSGKKAEFFKAQQYVNDYAFKGACLVPKRGLHLEEAEVARVIGASNDCVNSIAFKVPRRTQGFHQEIYPWTADLKPALSCADYFGGANKNPLLINPQEYVVIPEGEGMGFTNELKQAQLEEEKKYEMPKDAKYVKTETRKKLEAKMKKTAFTNVMASEPREKAKWYFDMKMSTSLPLCRNLSINGKFLAYAGKVSGGSSVVVLPLSSTGRVTLKPKCVRGHRAQVASFALSPIQEQLLATGGQEGRVLVYELPAEGLSKDLEKPKAELKTNGSKVTVVEWHPTVPDVLCTVALENNRDASIQFWDTRQSASSPKCSFDDIKEAVMDVAFSPGGTRVAVTSKDGNCYIVDPVAGRAVAKFAAKETVRDASVFWVDVDHVIVAGFQSGSRRAVSLYKVSTGKAVKSVGVGSSNATPIVHMDRDTGLAFVAGNGSPLIHVLLINVDKAPYIKEMPTFTSSCDVTGHCFFHKTQCDIKGVEVAKSLKLSRDKVLPVSWKVPRKRTDFFQDDIFCPTFANEAAFSTEDFFSGKHGAQGKAPRLVDLTPKGMTPLSDAPPEKLTERQLRYKQHLLQKEKPKRMNALGHSSAEEVQAHFRDVAQNMPTTNRWDAKVDNSQQDVDEDEWD